ncbi:hypothetical protein D3C83_109080 [compost metagenome]
MALEKLGARIEIEGGQLTGPDRDAFRKISADPAFVGEGKKMSEDFAPQSPEDVENLVRTVGKTSPAAIAYITTLMRKQGIRVE